MLHEELSRAARRPVGAVLSVWVAIALCVPSSASEPCSVTFSNTGTEPLWLFWQAPSGKLNGAGTKVDPDDTTTMRTYGDHRWIVKKGTEGPTFQTLVVEDGNGPTQVLDMATGKVLKKTDPASVLLPGPGKPKDDLDAMWRTVTKRADQAHKQLVADVAGPSGCVSAPGTRCPGGTPDGLAAALAEAGCIGAENWLTRAAANVVRAAVVVA
jgi:hypothetical protein